LSLVRRFFSNKHCRNRFLKKKQPIVAIPRACASQKFLTPESDIQGNFLSGPKRKKFFMLM
ncbi:hypothetical protein, partial [Faecalicatena contorta]|uniref:hypothetical protein n=1 Tax=Faecalicatena contorta TaxID=39482 RepID=UPI0019613C5C